MAVAHLLVNCFISNTNSFKPIYKMPFYQQVTWGCTEEMLEITSLSLFSPSACTEGSNFYHLDGLYMGYNQHGRIRTLVAFFCRTTPRFSSMNLSGLFKMWALSFHIESSHRILFLFVRSTLEVYQKLLENFCCMAFEKNGIRSFLADTQKTKSFFTKFWIDEDIWEFSFAISI